MKVINGLRPFVIKLLVCNKFLENYFLGIIRYYRNDAVTSLPLLAKNVVEE